MLDGPVVPETSPDCRAELGDRDCRVDMAARRLLVRVTAVDGDVIAIEAGLAEGLYAFGRLRWLEGRNAGLTQIVLASDAEGVTLADAPPFAVARSEEHTSELQSLMRI